jgi:hypothetical protein
MFVSCNLDLGQGLLQLTKLLYTSLHGNLCVVYCNRAPGATMAPTMLRQCADLRKAITTDKKVHTDLDRHARCAMAQRRGVNPGICSSKSTKKATRP